MKIICCLVGVLLLSSCVYYGTEYDFDTANKNTKSACGTGTKKENDKCRAEIRKVNEAIHTQSNKPSL